MKIDKQILNYYDLFPMLRALETERKGIKDRIWKWMCKEEAYDDEFRPYNGRISYINLYYYGVGEEFKIKSVTKEDIEHSANIHPEAFVTGSKEESIRLDLNLIWKTYEDELDDIEAFAVLVSW